MIAQLPFCPVLTLNTNQLVRRAWWKQQKLFIIRRLPVAIIFMALMILVFVLWVEHPFPIYATIPGFVIVFAQFFQKLDETHFCITLPLSVLPNDIAGIIGAMATVKGFRKVVPAVDCFDVIAVFRRPVNEATTLVCVAVRQLNDNEAKIFISAYGINGWGANRLPVEIYARRIAENLKRIHSGKE